MPLVAVLNAMPLSEASGTLTKGYARKVFLTRKKGN
jgi:hypothetical protein